VGRTQFRRRFLARALPTPIVKEARRSKFGRRRFPSQEMGRRPTRPPGHRCRSGIGAGRRGDGRPGRKGASGCGVPVHRPGRRRGGGSAGQWLLRNGRGGGDAWPAPGRLPDRRGAATPQRLCPLAVPVIRQQLALVEVYGLLQRCGRSRLGGQQLFEFLYVYPDVFVEA
jgi:hypothetical protein